MMANGVCVRRQSSQYGGITRIHHDKTHLKLENERPNLCEKLKQM